MPPAATAPPAAAPAGRREGALLAAITLLALAVPLFEIGNPALTLDEYTSLVFTRETWRDLLVTHWATDTHRPFFYALLKGWIALAGEDRVAVRALNPILHAAAVPVAWAIARRIGPPGAGLFAALAFALMPVLVAQAREVRMYPLVTLCTGLATLALIAALDRYPPERNGDGAPAGARGWWIAFAATAAGAFYAQSSTLFFMVLAGGAILIAAALGLVRAAALFHGAAAALLYAVLILPGIAPMLLHVTTTLRSFWIPEPTPAHVRSQVMALLPGGRLTRIAVLAAMLGGAFALRRRPAAVLVLAAMIVGLPLLFWAASLWQPILITRALTWPMLGAAVLIGAALAALPRAAGLAGAAALAAVQLASLAPLYPAGRQVTEIERLAPVLAAFDPAADTLILGFRDDELALRWHHPHLFAGRRVHGFFYGDRPTPFEPLMRSVLVRRADAAGVSVPPGRLWVIYEGRPMFPVPPERDVDGALAVLAAKGPLTERHTDGRLTIDIHAVAP